MTLWFELIGMDPEWDGYGSASFDKFSMKRTNDEIKESMTLDPTMVTAYMLLESVSKTYLAGKTFSATKLDEDEDAVFEYLTKVREFKKLIKDPEINRAVDEYKERLRKALVHIGCDGDAIGKFLGNNNSVAFIRLDALISSDRLRADQFMSGDTDPPEIRPLYNPDMFSYWNVNSMVEHICSMPAGMSLNLVRDPDELHSYFAIAIRNGGNVLILTDVPEYAHPMGREMSRRPDRAQDARAGQNWFPYDTLNIAYNEEGDPYHDIYRETKEKGLVPHQPAHFAYAKLGELDIRCAAWLTQVFDLIIEKYWNQPWPQRQLSYTTEMIRFEDETKMLAAAVNANLPVTQYERLALKPLTMADVLTDALDEAAIGKPYGNQVKNYGRNRWMEERYKHLVPEEALNLLSMPNKQVPLLSNRPLDGKVSQFGGENVPVVIEDAIQYLPAKVLDCHFGPRVPAGTRLYPVKTVDSTIFGTREQIDADRKFLARSNFARAIQMEADNEFVRERNKMIVWYEKEVRTNLDFIKSYACFGVDQHTYRVRDCGPNMSHRWGNEDKNTGRQFYTFSRLIDMTAKHDIYDWGYMSDSQVSLNGGWDYSRGGAQRCYFDETRATYALQIRPGCAADLALLCGCEISALPFFLQMWNPYSDDAYIGNSILDRIDPLEWRLYSPWHKMDFGVRLSLSRRALTRIRKECVAPPEPDKGDARHTGMIIKFGGGGNGSKADHGNWRKFDDNGVEKSRR